VQVQAISSSRPLRKIMAMLLIAAMLAPLFSSNADALDLSKYRKTVEYNRSATSSILTSGSQADLMYVKMNDWWLQDAPGILTTTSHVHGYSRTYVNSVDSSGVTSTRSIDRFTCSGANVSSISIGASGPSISGGVTSRTATWDTSNTFSSAASTGVKGTYHYYRDSGMFNCKVPNLPAKITHSTSGTVRRNSRDFSGSVSWERWW